MNNSSKHNKKCELKIPSNRSHNQGSELIAFIEFLARCAAEEDYKSLSTRQDNQTDTKGLRGEDHD